MRSPLKKAFVTGAVAASAWVLACRPAAAHNGLVHREMTRLSFALMGAPKSPAPIPSAVALVLVVPPPRGVSAADWSKFLTETSTAAASLKKLSTPCPKGADDPSVTSKTPEENLGDCAAAPDYNTDDTHLSVNVTSVGGLGTAKKLADDAAKAGVGLLLVPFVCAIDCVGSFLGFGSGDCDDCLKHAKKLADKTPSPSDVTGLLPLVGDVSGENYTGMWHFINLSPGVSDLYDDHQGLFYEEAGVNRVPGVIDIAITLYSDALGMTVNYDKSDGVHKYQITGPGDSFPDGDKYSATDTRGKARWQEYPFAHTPFEPVDNLAYYGWSRFRSGDHTYENLGYPLHALGDATVPMHVTGTTSWGHRPFEDAQEHLWPKLLPALQSGATLAQIFQRAYEYRQEIVKWQASGHGGDIPVRHLVRAVARHTYDYSFSIYNPISAATRWPFDDYASLLYHTGGKDIATQLYEGRADAVALVTPLLADGIAAEIAFLTSVGRLPGVALGAPAHRPAVASRPASGADAAVGQVHGSAGLPPGGAADRKVGATAHLHEQGPHAADAKTAAAAPRGLQIASAAAASRRLVRLAAAAAPPTAAVPPVVIPPVVIPPVASLDSERFAAALSQEYARLATLVVTGKLLPSQYRMLLQDRSRKAALARKDPTWARDWVQGDEDHDFVPNNRDRCPHTPDLTPTDDHGCPVRAALPPAPGQQDLLRVLAAMNIAIGPKCVDAPAPITPVPIKFGYDAVSRKTFAMAVSKVTNVPAGCPVFYEMSFRLTGNAASAFFPELPEQAYADLVFRDSDNTDLGPSGKARQVFRIRGTDPDMGNSKFLFSQYARYRTVEWRVRAVTANGLASPWSSWKQSPSVSFWGEPQN